MFVSEEKRKENDSVFIICQIVVILGWCFDCLGRNKHNMLGLIETYFFQWLAFVEMKAFGQLKILLLLLHDKHIFVLCSFFS